MYSSKVLYFLRFALVFYCSCRKGFRVITSPSQCRRVKGKMEGYLLGCSKQGYNALIYLEALDFFIKTTLDLTIVKSFMRSID